MARLLRSRNTVLGVLVALAVPAIALVPLAASGEPKKSSRSGAATAPSSEKSDRYDVDNITAISQYMETLAKGNERYVAKDYTSAIDAYKKAVLLSPKQALAHYLLTEAYLQANNMGEAEASIALAVEANDAKNPALRSRVLFLVADIQERQKKWEQAKVAWQAYAEHLARFGDAGAPQTGVERIKAIQKVLDQDKAYVTVKERIAADKTSAGKPAVPPKKAPPSAASAFAPTGI